MDGRTLWIASAVVCEVLLRRVRRYSVKCSSSSSRLSIASLLPSTTEICGELGLGRFVKGITHECDIMETGTPETLWERVQRSDIFVITRSHINPHIETQAAIDDMVKNSLKNHISLYDVDEEALRRADPTIILTQDLCHVCAPSKKDVDAAISRLLGVCSSSNSSSSNNNTKNTEKKVQVQEVKVLSLEPTTIEEVGDTFVEIAEACGMKEKGENLKDAFHTNFKRIQATTEDNRSIAPPRVLMLEWLDPPFDGGHWISEMIESAGCTVALSAGVGMLQKYIKVICIEFNIPSSQIRLRHNSSQSLLYKVGNRSKSHGIAYTSVIPTS